MGGYPWIYWLVVLLVASAVAVVLMGIGYLLGLQVAARRMATACEARAPSRICREASRPTEYTVPLSAGPGPKKERIR